MVDFDYTRIPLGYYDQIFRGPKGIRRLWHVSKFERVLDVLPTSGGSLLDIGCFAGTFLSTVPAARFPRQLGIDILPEQIAYATTHHGAPFRAFRTTTTRALVAEGARFDVVTAIELLEHLEPAAVQAMLEDLRHLLVPGGRLVITTPNYRSAWPLLELGLSWFSDMQYQEQHRTRFSYPSFETQLSALCPDIWRQFVCTVKTTTHFLTPFLAAASYDLARTLSRVVPHRAWRHPFGNLIFAVLERR